LEARFGPVDQDLRDRLCSESADALGAAIERALVAHRLDDVLEVFARPH
jgi:hypothetical protein